ncbi:MAG: class I SAM-dependent methyltransferase [Pseudomonadota bacterium]
MTKQTTQLSYERQTYRSVNPLARFAHGSRFGLSQSLASGNLPSGATLIDYGAGDGRFLRDLSQMRSDAELYGLEPYMKPPADGDRGFTRLTALEQAQGREYGVITCFEVLEHLEPADTDIFVDFVQQSLAPDGYLIVSVPIMYGPVLVPKALNAKYVKKSDWSYSLTELIRGVLARPVERDPGNLYLNHKGYDWRKTRDRLNMHFEEAECRFSPFSSLWWGFNSQWFGVFRKPRAQ